MSARPIRPALKVVALVGFLGLGALSVFLVSAFAGEPAPGTADRARLSAAAGSRSSAARGRAPRGVARGALGFRDSAGAAPERGHAADPQVQASRRSLAQLLDMGPGPRAPETHRLALVRTEGALALDAGEDCELRMLPVRAPGFDCLVAVRCGERVLYPDPALGAGYARCRGAGPDLRITDDYGTLRDGDPQLRVDLRQGRVEVGDEGPNAFRAELRRLGPLPRI